MRTVGNRNLARDRIPLHIVTLKTPRRKLHDVDIPLCRELARPLIIGQIIALKCNRRRRISRHGVPQILLHRRHIRKQLLLLCSEPVRTLLPPLIFDEIQMLKACIRIPSIGGMNLQREYGTGGSQRE